MVGGGTVNDDRVTARRSVLFSELCFLGSMHVTFLGWQLVAQFLRDGGQTISVPLDTVLF